MGVFSFGSGPSALPRGVIENVQRDVAEWRDSGQSLLELPFSGCEFEAILGEAERDLRQLLMLPESHRVLFLQGGAFTQFAVLPMNLLGSRKAADYVETGYWSRRAITEAAPWAQIRLAGRGDGVSLPDSGTWRMSPTSAYCHFTSNETADGLQFQTMPTGGPIPLVADMSADFLSRPIPIERFGMIYASAQKSLGAAGLTVVVIREDLLGAASPCTPGPLDYTRQARERSRVNTPPTVAISIAAHMLRWLLDSGGLTAAETRSKARSAEVYATIDRDGFYSTPVAVADRSRVSVRFHLPSPALEALFREEAESQGLLHLAGHPAVGGFRASLYNGISERAVDALVTFMNDFRRRRG
ncbi:MAG: 3-phosphoserine/phosphohydroxythreonine transaminase [Pseudomonadota bacterium]